MPDTELVDLAIRVLRREHLSEEELLTHYRELKNLFEECKGVVSRRKEGIIERRMEDVSRKRAINELPQEPDSVTDMVRSMEK